MSQTILIIDDEEDIRDLLGEIFEDEGYLILKAAHSEQALAYMSQHQIDLIVLDIWLDNSDMDGIQILKHLKGQTLYAQIPVLMISGHGNVEMAVNAMKIGAFDFIEKPFKIDHILLTVQRALEQKALREENATLQGIINADTSKTHYKSSAMTSLMKSVCEHAESDARILIAGQMGTGKTRLAKIIHGASKRSSHAIRFLQAENLSSKRFLEELQHNYKGTIVFENIDRLNQQSQNDFLGVLNSPQTDCRIICTASQTIDDQVKNRSFSSALYDRLAVLRYDVPSLSQRHEDLSILVQEFIESYQREYGISVKNDFLPYEKLKSMQWPGNVKQLKAVAEWMAMCQIGHKTDTTISYMIPLKEEKPSNIISYPPQVASSDLDNLDAFLTMPLKEARDFFEYKYLGSMLEKFDGNIAKVAAFIEMDRTALHRKLKSMNLTSETKAKAESS